MIGWWTDTRQLSMAGIRIRVHLVMQALLQRRVPVSWVRRSGGMGYDTVVLHKHYDDNAYAQVLRWQAAGTRVIFDLCDNLLYYPDSPVKGERRGRRLKRMLAAADDVVVSTETLADVVASECREIKRMVVIGDSVDDLSVIPVSLLDRLRVPRQVEVTCARLRQLNLQNHTRLLWFGNHGSGYADSGMLHLAALRAQLESVHRYRPLSLTVISNHRRKFERHFSGWSLPCHYQPWHPLSFERLARCHDIALIPVQDNPFTRCKSDNRLVTAMMHGLAVVADDLPSYRPYASVAQVGDVITGLQAYLDDPERRRQFAAAGRKQVQDSASIQRIADQWQALLRVA